MVRDLARRVSQLAPIAMTTLSSFALAACSDTASPETTGGRAGSAMAGAAGRGTSATGGAGGATVGGGAGVTTSNGGTSGGVADTDAAGSGEASGDASRIDAETMSDARTDAPDIGVESGAGSCAPPGVLCDDFEKYAAGSTNLGPDWTTYTYSGAVRVDATKPRGGKQSLHVTTQAG